MGTQKRIVLASVVSMMLVLAFMVGFVPSHDAELTGASSSDGRVDMAGLLDMVLGDKAAITSIVPSSSANGLLFVTPITNFETPYIPVGLTSTTVGADGSMYYVIDPFDPANPTVNPNFRLDGGGFAYWAGLPELAAIEASYHVYTGRYVGPAQSPLFPVTANIGVKVPPTAALGLQEFSINALAATNLYTASGPNPPDYIYYSVKNLPANQILVGLLVADGTSDADGNALPDDVWGATANGAWVANANLASSGPPDVRKVNVQDLSFTRKSTKAAPGTVIIPVRPDVTVEVPSEAALLAAGVIGAGDTVVAVVSVTDDLSGAIDGTQATRTQWANDALAGAPGQLVVGAPIVQIAFVANVGGAATQINDLGGLTATVHITGIADLAANADKPVQVWGVHTATDGSTFTPYAGPAANEWHSGDGAPVVDYANGTIDAVLSTFSAFVPLYSELRVYDAAPKKIPADIPGLSVELTLTGIFPTAMGASVYQGLTVAEATANYNVFIHGALASFRNVDRLYTRPDSVQGTAHEAVTLLQTNPLAPNTMYLNAPNFALPTVPGFVPVDVTVENKNVPGSGVTLSGTLTASPTGEVITTTSGSGTGTVALTPANGLIAQSGFPDIVFPSSRYLIGDAVNAAATTLTGTFAAWTLNGTQQPGSVPSLDLNVGVDPTIVDAQFNNGFALTLLQPVEGAITASPPQPAGGYLPGTVVTLTATAADPLAFVFSAWSGPNGAEVVVINATQGTITMNADKSVSAVFVPVDTFFQLTLVQPAEGLIIASPPQPAGGYLAGTVVTLTATASDPAAFAFTAWSDANGGEVAPPNFSPGTLVMNGPKTVGAVFTAIYPLTLVQPAEGTIVASPPQPAGGYLVGTVVTLTATATDPAAFVFSAWSGANGGDVTPANATPGTITMTGAKTVGATFVAVVTTKNLSLTSANPVAGTVTANPLGISGGTLYTTGTAVTIVAVPAVGVSDSRYVFDRWTGADGVLLADPTNLVQNIVMDADKEFIANFKLEMRIDSIDPPLIPADIPVPITLTGIFQTSMGASIYQGLTVPEATANYTVLIGGALASFRNVDSLYTRPDNVQITRHEAVTLLETNPLTPNKMYLTSPLITLARKAVGPTFVDVTVQNISDPALIVTLTATLEVSATGEVIVTTSGTGAGSVALTPPNGSILLSDDTVVNFPANRYLIGDVVSAAATAAVGSNFIAWSGAASGSANPQNITVAANPTNLNAQFDLPITKYLLTIVSPANGSIGYTPSQPVGGFPSGTVVTLTATANGGFTFNTWTGANGGDVVPTGLGTGTIIMNSAKTVSANFQPIITTKRLTLTANAGGTVAANPLGNEGGNVYNTGAAVTITATASAQFKFDHWTGASAATLTDPTNRVQNIVMDTDKELIANFHQVLNITAILPNTAWIFGGVVAKVSGTGLSATTQFTLGGKTLFGFNAAADGSSIDIVIPATDDRFDTALVVTTLTATEGAVTSAAIPFTYKRHVEDTATGTNTTAFILDTPATENTVKLDTGGGDITSGKLIIPGLNTSAAQVYGIVLDQKLVVKETKSTTAPVPSGDLSASLIDNAAAGAGVQNAYDFSIFVYKAAVDKATMPPAQNAVYVDASADLAATLGRGTDANGIPNAGTAMQITLPLGGTGLAYADVRKGLAQWGIEAQYDYASNTESFTDPKVEAYQSELLQNEVDPNMTTTTPDADQPDQMLKARLYSLNGFSLRKAWTLPADVAAAIRLAKVDGKLVAGTGSGSQCGGTVLTLVSPLGGLGYVDHVDMLLAGKIVGTAKAPFVSVPGADEYTFEFKTPKSKKAGIVDIAIYLKSSPDTAAAVLDKKFEYKAKSANLTPLLLLLLGILLALIGIAAGHDSGHGGGGPCFIATAAYGTPLVAEIDTLRAVRDTYLLDNAVGSAFVDTYYRVSPAIADAVAQSPVLAAVVRLALVPVIFLGKLALLMPAPMALLALAFGAVCLLRRRARGRA